MNKKDLVLNNLQWLICHKTKPNQTNDIDNDDDDDDDDDDDFSGFNYITIVLG